MKAGLLRRLKGTGAQQKRHELLEVHFTWRDFGTRTRPLPRLGVFRRRKRGCHEQTFSSLFQTVPGPCMG